MSAFRHCCALRSRIATAQCSSSLQAQWDLVELEISYLFSVFCFRIFVFQFSVCQTDKPNTDELYSEN